MTKTVLDRTFIAHPDQLKAMRSELKKKLAEVVGNDTLLNEIVLAINEACMNIIQHGYAERDDGDFRLEVEYDEQRELLFRLTDHAAKVDVTKIRSRDLDDVRPGGLGVHFINALMDEVEFIDSPSHSGNILQMKKKI